MLTFPGDWFTHFLDSPEQALLIIPLFTDIKPKGGGTVICTDSVKLVAERLVRTSTAQQTQVIDLFTSEITLTE